MANEGVVEAAAKLAYWGADEARVIVEAWRRSGQTLSRFANRHGIHPQRLGRWARKLEEEGEAVRFHPVRLVGHEAGAVEPSAQPIEIVLGDGPTVRVPPGFTAEDLQRVLAVLGAAG